MLAAATLIWGVGSAAAGQYSVWSCRGPDGSPISADAWRTQVLGVAPGDITIADSCADRGSLRIEAARSDLIFDHQPFAEATFEPPAGTTIPKFEVWRYVAAGGGYPLFPHHQPFGGYAASFQEWILGSGLSGDCAAGRHDPECAIGEPDAPLDDANLLREDHAAASEPPAEKLGFWVGCVRVGCEPAITPPDAVFELFRSRVTVEDDRPPTIDRVEGSMAEAAPVSGVARLFVRAGDVGGGVAAFEISVDGGPSRRLKTASGDGRCEEPFWAPRPCPPTATRGFAVDTGELAPGGHTVSGAVIDAAGNATRFGPLTFTVATRGGGKPEVRREVVHKGVAAASGRWKPNNGSPAIRRPRLRLDRTRSPRRGRSSLLRGILTTPAGRPIAAARLLVWVTELGERRHGKPRTVRTDAHGRFAIKLGGHGARNVVVAYAPTVGGSISRTAERWCARRSRCGCGRGRAR